MTREEFEKAKSYFMQCMDRDSIPNEERYIMFKLLIEAEGKIVDDSVKPTEPLIYGAPVQTPPPSAAPQYPPYDGNLVR